MVKGLIPGSNIELFDNYKSDYFQRLYRLSFLGDNTFQEETIQKLNSIKFIKRVERVYLFEELSIKINEDSKSLTNDLFFPYLWGLKNSGQTILRDLDDIHFETLVSASNADIGWSEKIKDLMKEEVIVGVLDSGVDYDHPDLKDNIAKNLAECVNGAIPFKPKKDLDGNGYFGDCAGWNFTGRDVGGDNRPVDDIGHGTHVAGIIAAVSENKIGVSGLSNKIKILPIKVLKKDDSTPGANGSLSDRVAKGILFAIKSKAKVINLSLGWPIILDTFYLRQAFKTAIEKNITIVAASGNNSNNSPIFPCAYENVICVSSIGVDGKISNFSNYGGQVDVLAPGDNILSTYPTIKDPDLFFAKGYELKNGTSQASPFVAASVAVLKSVYPGITENEAKARLILSTKPTDFFGTEPEKYTSQGLINLEEAINLKEQPLVIPILKELNSISIDEINQSFSLPLKIKNLWKDANNVKIKLTSLNGQFNIDKRDFEFSEIKEGQAETVNLIGTIDDLSQDHNFDFQIEITQDEKTRIFKQNVKVVGTLGEKIKRVPILGLSETDLIKKDPYLFPKIKTVSDPLNLAKNPYY
ncbi:MAG: S8 family peptidase, partial [Bacteriovoracales bacterium]